MIQYFITTKRQKQILEPECTSAQVDNFLS